uniref:Uncharacterized protein n=1 Tax=Arundo donax TaxID=35708 RepID=A0A0A9AK13_ARUDO
MDVYISSLIWFNITRYIIGW